MKRKLAMFALALLFGLAMMSCDFFFTSQQSETMTQTTQTTSSTLDSSETTLVTSITSASTTDEQSTTTETTTTETTTTETTTTETITTTQTTTQTTESSTTETTTFDPNAEPFYPTGYSLLQDEMDEIGIPSEGDINILVFAVDFSDYPSETYGTPISDLETAYNATSDQIDFESLKSFYQKSSFDKLNLSADIYGYYRAEHPSTYYEDAYEAGQWYTDSDLINEVLTYYDGTIDYSQYDANDDGFIDGIYIVYTHPVSWSSEESDLWWAYQYYYAYLTDRFDGVKPNYFVWSGSEFYTDDNGYTDARTVIHETGHMLGLDDYYDYYPGDANNNEGGLGGGDMMDSAMGDHGPFSKILLGWITPLVVEEGMEVDLMAYAQTGEVLLVIDSWENTIFDEYLLVMFYTPTDLYEDDAYYYYTVPGVVIYHVSAAIDDGYNPDLYYYSIFNNNNTDTEDKLITIIEADMEDNHVGGNRQYDPEDYTQDSDLFMTGDILGDTIYPDYEWYTGVAIGFDIEIVAIDTYYVTILITHS